MTIASVVDLRASVRLNMWKSSLPEELEITPRLRLTATPHKLMLHLAYWWLTILLHRPFFHRKSRQIHSMDREIDHVKVIKTTYYLVRNLYNLFYFSYVDMLQNISWTCYLPGVPSTNSDTVQSPSSKPPSLLARCTFLQLCKLAPELVLLGKNFDIPWIKKRWCSNTFKK